LLPQRVPHTVVLDGHLVSVDGKVGTGNVPAVTVGEQHLRRHPESTLSQDHPQFGFRRRLSPAVGQLDRSTHVGYSVFVAEPAVLAQYADAQVESTDVVYDEAALLSVAS